MRALETRLSDALYKHLRFLAELEGISINRPINTAVLQRLSALDTETLPPERARKGSSAAFFGLLAKVPSDPPLRGDQLT